MCVGTSNENTPKQHLLVLTLGGFFSDAGIETHKADRTERTCFGKKQKTN
jgi:hypothetical protein